MTVDHVTDLITVGLTFAGLVLVIRQLSLARRISAADFAVRLDDDLYKYKHVFREFFPDGKWAPGNEPTISNDEAVEIREYLAFYETLNTLRKRRLVASFLNLEDIDELFGYRFFITMHNPVVKNILARDPESWRVLQSLYWDWLEFRIAAGRPILQREYQWIR